MKYPIVDLGADYLELKAEIDQAVERVLTGGWYILGQETAAFEAEFAAFCDRPYCLGVASGTDAVLLALKAIGVGPGDEVITVAHTAVATVVAIELAGARPVLVDVDPLTMTLDPAGLATAITPRTKAIIPVHLYGHPADLAGIQAQIAAQAHKIYLVEDCAQAHGAGYGSRPVGSWGDVASFSFYPTKNLGAFGDGGAIVTADPQIAERLKMLRQYGWKQRYISDITGYNSRLDELQAAILRVKLSRLANRNRARRQLAAIYRQELADSGLGLPAEPANGYHVYHLFVVQSQQRDQLQAYLQANGVGTAIHYPVPIHLQPAYHHLGYPAGSLPITERLAQEILSLPMYPQLTPLDILDIADIIKNCKL